jgi:hypothetical protein
MNHEWDRFVTPPMHKFVTGATLLQLHWTKCFRSSVGNLVQIYRSFAITGNYGRQSFSKYGISYYDAYYG